MRATRVPRLVILSLAFLILLQATPAAGASGGALDPSFGDDGVTVVDLGVDAGATMRIGRFSDGRFVVLGSSGDSYSPYLAWFEADGTPTDVTPVDFGDTAILQDLAVDPENRVMVVGRTDLSASSDFLIARFTESGIDTSFGTGGVVTVDFGGEDSAAAAALDGSNIVIAGWARFSNGGTGVVRLLPTGAFDTSFSFDGRATFAGMPGWDVAVSSDHNVYVGINNFSVARLTAQGQLDTSYGSGGVATAAGFGDFVHGMALQPDGRAIVAGQACCELGAPAFAVARFDAGGRPDTSFDGDGKLQFIAPNRAGQGTASAIAVQPDGRVVVVGGQQDAGPTYDGSLVVRLNADGSFDQSFGDGGKVLTQSGYDDTFATDVVLQPDGPIVTAGFFGESYSPLYSYLFLARYTEATEPVLAPPPTTAPPTTAPTNAPPTTTAPPPAAPPPAPPPAAPPPTVPRAGGTSRPAPTPSGYWMTDRAGHVYGFGDAPWLGNAPVGQNPAVDLEPTPSGRGYWITDDLGHVFSFGDARWLGNAGRLGPDEKVTSLSRTPSGAGYWIFTTRGRVVAVGDAVFLGDMSAVRLNGPVLDSIPTATGRGYYMVASDGGIFTFGDAAFYGSMGNSRLNQPVQSLVPDSDGVGYWLVASDGGLFSFRASFYGSMGSTKLNMPITGMVGFGSGYLMVAEDGGIFSFGDAVFKGSLGSNPPPHPVVSAAVFARR